MNFDWLTAIYSLIIFAVPITLLLGSWAFVEEHFVLTVFCTVVFLACIFLAGGLPDPMIDR